MPYQFPCPFQKYLDVETNENYERHFRFFWEDDIIIILKITVNNYTLTLRNTSTTYGKGEEVSEQVRGM